MQASDARWKDVLLLAVFAAAIHLPFHFGSVCGEEDLARQVVDALILLKTGSRAMAVTEYPNFISSGYIWLIRELVKAGGSTEAMAFWINTLQPICAVLIVVPVYFLGARLLGRMPALLGTLLFCMIPTVWVSGLYGFPSLPALFFVVIALVLYDLRLTRPPLGNVALHLALVEILIFGALLLKADFWLSCVALFGLVWMRQGLRFRWFAEAAAVAAVPVLLLAFAAFRSPQDVLGILTHWSLNSGSASLTIAWLAHQWALVKGMGIVTAPLFFIALVALAFRRKYSFLFLFASWVFVTMACWFAYGTDDARHHLPEAVPIAFAIGWLLTLLPGKRYVPWVGLLAIFALNYFAFKPSSSTRFPSGRVFESARMIRERNAAYQRLAKEYVAVESSRKVILGSFTNPYVDAEVLDRATAVTATRHGEWLGHDAIEIEYIRDGHACISASVRVPPRDSPEAARTYRNAGFSVFSMEFDLRTGKLVDPEHLEKLVEY